MAKKILYILLTLSCLSCVHTEVDVHGNLSGTVKIQNSEQIITNCKVSLDNGEEFNTNTNSEGQYSFKDVEIGAHAIFATKEGFFPFKDSVLIRAGQTMTFDVAMRAMTLPTLQTQPATEIQFTSAKLNGVLVNNGGGTIKEIGFYFGESQDNCSKLLLNLSDTLLTYDIIDLEDGKQYWFCAFAVTEVGEAKGDWLSFQTTGMTLAQVVTKEAQDVNSNAAKLVGEVAFAGNTDITERGFYLKTIGSDYVQYKADSVESNIFFRHLITLMHGTTYYFKAYVKNLKGESLGEEVSFTTIRLESPKFTTPNVKDNTYSSINVSCEITDDGGSAISGRGFCYGLTEYPTIDNSKVEVGTGTGSFSKVIEGLQEGTHYYLRAYAINAIGVAYSEQVTFSTIGRNIPTVVTNDVTNLSYVSVTLNGSVESDGGLNVSERGFCYATTTTPTISNNKHIVGSGTGAYSFDLSSLTDGTTYYVRAYAVNSKGTAYGNEKSFKTIPYTLPTVVAKEVSGVKATSAIVSCETSADGGKTITERGVCYGTSSNPTTSNSKSASGSGIGNYSCNLTNLSEGVTYYVRAYAINEKGTSYSSQLSFKTIAEALPTISTLAASNISYTSATIGGNVTATGGGSVTTRGVCYATTQNPTISNTKVASGSGAGTYNVNLTGLSDGTTYYARAYATNSKGTAYGNQITFSTNPYKIPTVTTIAAYNVTHADAICPGNVSDNGGLPITERGVFYSTSSNPKTSGTKIVCASSGSGDFVCSLSGLKELTTYYFVAYAKNNKGIAYGSVLSFKTALDEFGYSGKENNHEYIDLGLSVKWALVNIGANSRTSNGNYYAWAETNVKTSYEKNNYKYYNKSTQMYTKYSLQSLFGIADNKKLLEMTDDAASVNWGGKWRLPTVAEAQELMTKCTWTYTSGGYYIVKGPNGKKICIPASGYYDGSTNIRQTKPNEIHCYYWTNELNSGTKTTTCYDGSAKAFEISNITTLSRMFGLPIRPVCP